MSLWKEVFPSIGNSATSTTAPLSNTVDVVDLRREFDSLVLGTYGETPIGRPFILRRMRRDSGNNLVSCSCVSEVTREPDRDYPCPFCLGSGTLWDEELITAYKVVASAPGGSNSASNYQKMPVGAMYSPAVRFFLSSTVVPTRDDRIVELELDAEGDIITPYNRIAIFELYLVRAMRADSGKIEYWICSGQTMGPKTQGFVG